jgi:hypothetical protein
MSPISRLLSNRRHTAAPKTAAPTRTVASGTSGLLLDDERRPTYDEQAFRYFLSVERARSERSNRPFLLLLLDLKTTSEGPCDPGVRLFEALWSCLRDTDFIGWYRSGRVIGAVLTQHAAPADVDVSAAILRRVRAALLERVPSELRNRIQVRIYAEPPRPRDSARGRGRGMQRDQRAWGGPRTPTPRGRETTLEAEGEECSVIRERGWGPASRMPEAERLRSRPRDTNEV